jgi:small subunit ribosomal protein S6
MTGAYHLTQRSMVPKTAEKTTPTELEENKYELMVIITPDMSDDDMNKELNDLRKQIKDLKGEIYHEDLWNIRNLSYSIKKQDKGYYAVFYFTGDSLKVKDLDKGLFLNPKVLRHLIVKSPKGYVIKSLSELELTEEERKRPRTDKTGDRGGKFAERPARKPVVKTEEKPAEKEVKAVEKEPVKETKTKKEEKPMDISDLDSKLSSILDDSDLNMKL